MPSDKIENFKPDILKEAKKYAVSYHPEKGERVKLDIATEHKPGTPDFINHVHKEAKKLGHRLGSVGAHQEIDEEILELKPSDMIESPTPHADLAQEFVDHSKKKDAMKPTKLKSFLGKCLDFAKKRQQSLRSTAAPKGKIIKPTQKEKEEGLGDLLDPVRFHKPASSYKEFEQKIQAKKEGEVTKAMEQKIEGGLADKSKATEFDAEELRMGIQIEMEHTNDPEKAKEIAMDHLKEHPRYYTHLKEMEAKAKKEDAGKKESMDKPDLIEELMDVRKADDLEKVKLAEWTPKHPEIFGQTHKKYPKGSKVAFRHISGEYIEGHISDAVGDKVHIVDQKGNIWRIPESQIVSGEVHKAEGLTTTDDTFIKTEDGSEGYQVEVLKKSLNEQWLYQLGQEYASIAKAQGIPYKVVPFPQGVVNQFVFRVGDCAVIHKTLGRLIDVKMYYAPEASDAHKRVAKGLFQRMQAYYSQLKMEGTEKFFGPESMGIISKSDEDYFHEEIAHPDKISGRWPVLGDPHTKILREAKAKGTKVKARIMSAPFGSYLVNLAHTDEKFEKSEGADGDIEKAKELKYVVMRPHDIPTGGWVIRGEHQKVIDEAKEQKKRVRVRFNDHPANESLIHSISIHDEDVKKSEDIEKAKVVSHPEATDKEYKFKEGDRATLHPRLGDKKLKVTVKDASFHPFYVVEHSKEGSMSVHSSDLIPHKDDIEKSAKSEAKKIKSQIMDHLQSKMHGHQIPMMEITALANHAEKIHASGKSPESAATEAFEHFKKLGKITAATVPVTKSDRPKDSSYGQRERMTSSETDAYNRDLASVPKEHHSHYNALRYEGMDHEGAKEVAAKMHGYLKAKKEGRKEDTVAGITAAASKIKDIVAKKPVKKSMWDVIKEQALKKADTDLDIGAKVRASHVRFLLGTKEHQEADLVGKPTAELADMVEQHKNKPETLTTVRTGGAKGTGVETKAYTKEFKVGGRTEKCDDTTKYAVEKAEDKGPLAERTLAPDFGDRRVKSDMVHWSKLNPKQQDEAKRMFVHQTPVSEHVGMNKPIGHEHYHYQIKRDGSLGPKRFLSKLGMHAGKLANLKDAPQPDLGKSEQPTHFKWNVVEELPDNHIRIHTTEVASGGLGGGDEAIETAKRKYPSLKDKKLRADIVSGSGRTPKLEKAVGWVRGERTDRTWQEGMGGQALRRIKRYMQRKRRPQMGKELPHSMGERRLSRQQLRLFGLEGEEKMVGKSIKKTATKISMTRLGKQVAKALGLSTVMKPKKPSMPTPKAPKASFGSAGKPKSPGLTVPKAGLSPKKIISKPNAPQPLKS